MKRKSDPMQDKKPTILLVEDDEFMSSLLTFMLERQNMQVIHAADGRAALEHIQGPARCDALVLDLMLPQIGGMDILARIRQQAGWAGVPVLVVSALDSGAQIAAALQAGASDFVSKPFNPQELLARLTRLLPETATPTCAR